MGFSCASKAEVTGSSLFRFREHGSVRFVCDGTARTGKGAPEGCHINLDMRGTVRDDFVVSTGSSAVAHTESDPGGGDDQRND